MYFQLFKPHPNSFVIAIVLLLINIPVHRATDDTAQYYLDCSKFVSFSCGKTALSLTFPFWAKHSRPSYCGLEGYELGCIDLYPVINIALDREVDSLYSWGSEAVYRVVDINPSGSAIILERTHDQLVNDNCDLTFENTTLNNKLFEYSQGIEDLYMFYDCPLKVRVPVMSGVRNNYTCQSGPENKQVIFGVKSHLEDYLDTLHKVCKTFVRVPVTRPNLEKFSMNVTMLPRELLDSSFEVQFKINETACLHCTKSGVVCWKNPNSGVYPQCLSVTGKENNSRSKIRLKIAIASGIGGGGLLLLLVLIIYYRRVKTKDDLVLFSHNVSSDTKDVEAFIRQNGSSIPRRFRYSTIKKITNSFKDELGKGGYGNVYRGNLPDGSIVAVKVLNETKGNGEEFINEVASIGRTSHVNVVTLLGFCYEGKRRALIYEFMPNGSLEKFIYGTTPSLEGHLGWEKSYNIAIGIARGLEYLHRGCNTRILHFDIKPHNILLDQDFCPKISDFGLAKLYTTKESAVSSLLQARGTIGYIAPEVISRNFGQVSHKSDVYSYGMMILEMVGGRKNVNSGADHTSEIYYPRWLYKRIQCDDVLDLASEISVQDNERAKKMVTVGLWCIQTYPTQRPSITKVIEMLEGKLAALEIPPNPYLCSAPQSPSNSQTKLVFCSPSGTESASSP